MQKKTSNDTTKEACEGHRANLLDLTCPKKIKTTIEKPIFGHLDHLNSDKVSKWVSSGRKKMVWPI